MKRLLAASVLAVALAGVPAVGQTREGPAPSATYISPVVSIEFGGGTVSAYIDALRKAVAPQPVNVILSRDASTAEIAAISLKQVALNTALMAIEPAAGHASGDWKIRRINVERLDEFPANSIASAFSVDYMPRREMVSPMGPQPMAVEVFSIADLIRRQGGAGVPLMKDVPLLATVLSAVESAVELQADSEVKPELKFHEQSGLLILRGTERDHRAVRQVIERIQMDLDRGAATTASETRTRRAIENNLERAQIELSVQAQELELRRDQLAQASKMVEAGVESQGSQRELQLEVNRAEAKVRFLQLEIDKFRAELNDLSAASPGVERSYRLDGVTNKVAAIYQILDAMKEADGGSLPRYHHADGGALILTATEGQHKVFAAVLAGMRTAAPSR